jgi:hypothetical protein
VPSRTASTGLQDPGEVATAVGFANSVMGGWIGYNSTTTAQSTATETDLTNLSIQVTVNANRRILIIGYVPIGGFGTGAADERSIVRIKEGITELNQDAVTERLSNGAFITGVAKPMALSGTGNFGTPGAGLHTWKLSLEGLTTSNTTTACTTAPAATRPAWIAVFDVGPA